MMLRPALAAALMSAAAIAQAAPSSTDLHDMSTKVTPLMSSELQGIPGKESVLFLVEYPPGGSDPVHRHNATAFVYVLEGTIIMQVKGGKEMTLTKGQTFSEKPDDLHVIGRNASQTKPAKFLAFFVKDIGTPPVLPAE